MSETISVGDKEFVPYISEAEISARVRELGKKISEDYNGKNLLFVIVLKGASIFAADLIRAVSIPCEIDFLRARSYGSQMTSSGNVQIDLSDLALEGKHVILVEDIVDSGLTMSEVIRRMNDFSPASIRIAALLFKPESLKIPLTVEYVGMEIPSRFVVGYGLDYAEQGRNLPAIYVLKS